MLSSERGLSSASGSMWAERNASQPSRIFIQNPNMFSCDARHLPRLAGNGNTLRVKCIRIYSEKSNQKTNFCHKKYISDNLVAPTGPCLVKRKKKFNSQLHTSGREPGICDTPVSHSIDKPTEELKSIVIIGTLGFLPLYPLRLASTSTNQPTSYTHT